MIVTGLGQGVNTLLPCLLIGSLALPDLAKFFGGGAPPHPPLGTPCKAKISPAENASVYLSR